MTEARDFRALAEAADAERYLPDLIPWVHEAGNPYLDWLLGSPEAAREAIGMWMVREGSEISLKRVVALFEEGNPVGGFVALSGADLQLCARADTLTVLKAVGRRGRSELLLRAADVADLRTPVEPDEWFLSKLGVLEPFRRGGRGRAIVHEFLERGRAAGFSRFRLDVWGNDAHTVRMYESAGFHAVHEADSAALGGRLVAMRASDG